MGWIECISTVEADVFSIGFQANIVWIVSPGNERIHVSSHLLSSRFAFADEGFHLSFVVQLSAAGIQSDIHIIRSVGELFQFILDESGRLRCVLIVYISLQHSPAVPAERFVTVPDGFGSNNSVYIPKGFHTLAPIGEVTDEYFRRFDDLTSQLSVRGRGIGLVIIEPFVRVLVSAVFVIRVAGKFGGYSAIYFQIGNLVAVPCICHHSCFPVGMFYRAENQSLPRVVIVECAHFIARRRLSCLFGVEVIGAETYKTIVVKRNKQGSVFIGRQEADFSRASYGCHIIGC